MARKMKEYDELKELEKKTKMWTIAKIDKKYYKFSKRD